MKRFEVFKMRLFLIRHGESEAGRNKVISGQSDVPLSKLGKNQAIALGQEFLESGIKFDVVYSSDIGRASQTSAIICNILGIRDIIFDKRLREQDAGIFTGRKVSSLSKEEKEFLDNTIIDLDFRILGGKTNSEMTLRIKEAFYEIITNNPEDSTILLVAHGGIFYHLLVRVLALLPSKMEEWIGNCAKNKIERESPDDSWRVTMLNNKIL
jgi:broad specificity phosphatase PhoE